MAQKTHCCAASLPILQCAESSEVPSGLVYKHRGGSVDRRLCLQLRASILSGAFWRPRGRAGADAGETCWAAGCLFSPFEGPRCGLERPLGALYSQREADEASRCDCVPAVSPALLVSGGILNQTPFGAPSTSWVWGWCGDIDVALLMMLARAVSGCQFPASGSFADQPLVYRVCEC